MKLVALLPQNLALCETLRRQVEGHMVTFVACADVEAFRREAHETLEPLLLFTEETELQALTERDVHGPLAVFVTTAVPEFLGALPSGTHARHFLALRNGKPDENELAALVRRLVRPLVPAMAGPHDWLHAYGAFSSNVTPTLEQRVTSLEEKALALSRLRETVLSPAATPSKDVRASEYARKAVEIVDELILNAVFAANPRMQGLRRGHPFVLPHEEAVVVKWRREDNFLGLSVSDPFGGLRFPTLLSHLNAGALKGDVALKASAGLGLRMAFDRSHALFVDVDTGTRTEVVAFLHLEKTFREFDKRLRSLSFCGGEA
jgi:hypothetical protein